MYPDNRPIKWITLMLLFGELVTSVIGISTIRTPLMEYEDRCIFNSPTVAFTIAV